MKLIVKLPIGKNGKFKLQSRGNIPGKQYITGAGVLEAIKSVFLRKGLKEKIAIVVKEYIDGSFENVNESLPSQDSNYLIYITSCFLEDYLSNDILAKEEKAWTKWVKNGGEQQ